MKTISRVARTNSNRQSWSVVAQAKGKVPSLTNWQVEESNRIEWPNRGKMRKNHH